MNENKHCRCKIPPESNLVPRALFPGFPAPPPKPGKSALGTRLPRILSPKYGQTGKVKPLTANRSLSFAVKWPNLDFKDSISWLRWYLKMSWMKKQHRRAKQADRNSGEATAQVASLADIFLIWARFLPFSPTAEPGPRVCWCFM